MMDTPDKDEATQIDAEDSSPELDWSSLMADLPLQCRNYEDMSSTSPAEVEEFPPSPIVIINRSSL